MARSHRSCPAGPQRIDLSAQADSARVEEREAACAEDPVPRCRMQAEEAREVARATPVAAAIASSAFRETRAIAKFLPENFAAAEK